MFKLSIKTINYFIVFLFFIKEMLDGMLRFYLYSIGLTPLTYLPTLLISIFIFICFLTSPDFKANNYLFFEIVILIIWFFVGIFYSGFQQSLFNLYIFLPFFLGQLSSWIFYENWWIWRVTLVLIIVISFLGVLMDLYYDLPWQGFTYSIGEVEIEGNRSWTAFGINRISGFARSSFSLASILITALYLLFQKVGRFQYFVLWFLSGFSIVATTTKGIILVFVVFSIFMLIRKLSFLFYKYALRVSFYIIMIIGICLPLSSLIVDYSLGLNDPVIRMLLFSFEARLVTTWPEAFNLLDGIAGVLFGEGFGSVGTASMIYDRENYSPGDNLFVYLYLIFGVSIFFILSIIIKKFRVNALGSDFKEIVIHSFILILLYGIFSNILESAILGFLFGAIVGSVFGNHSLKSRV